MNKEPLKVDLMLFARSPGCGPVKTRMRSVLSDAQCQQLHKDMLQYCGAKLSGWSLGSRQCWHTGSCDFWHQWQDQFGFELHQQTGSDLGARMANAFQHSLSSSRAAIVVGADAVLGLDVLADMADVLSRQRRPVMLPADDGGYLALGLTRFAPGVFENMPWGGAEVAAITRQRLNDVGLDLAEWPARTDIDLPADLAKLAGTELSHWARWAPN